MYKTSRQLKQSALNSLKGKWGTAFLLNITTMLIVMPFTFTTGGSGFSSLLSIIINILTLILSVGYTSFLLKICCGQKSQATLKDLFYGFKCHPGKAICLYLLTFLYLLPGAIIYGILLGVFLFSAIAGNMGAFEALLYGDIYNLDMTMLSGLIGVFVLLTLLYAVYAAYISAKYGLVYLLLLDYPDLSATAIWKRSGQLMKGNKWRRIKLDLSFMPILLLLSIAVIVLAFIPIVNVIAFIVYFVAVFMISIHASTAGVEFYLDLMQHQALNSSAASTAASVSVPSEAYQNPTLDTSLTHDCEEAHGNSHQQRETDYSGIDMDSFK